MARKTKTKHREILFTLDAQSKEALYQQIYAQARSAISQGRLSAGDKLPSIRKLADALSVSHTTIEQAYSQLAVEGYVHNVPRSGYVVNNLDTDFLQLSQSETVAPYVQRSLDSRNVDSFSHENVRGSKVRYDFSYANLPASSFPTSTWRKLVNDVLYTSELPAFTSYAYVDRPSRIQEQVASYLTRARGAHCLPEQIIFQAGTEAALACIFELFDPSKHSIGIEEPGYATAIEVAKRMGFKLVPLPVTKGSAALLDAIHKHKPKLLFLTPSHQFPTGNVMQLETRIHLLQWAQVNNAYIIEDDSCNEYRYDSAPIPSLQSLDAYRRVIYVCNVSKVLSPSMRIAYTVLPPKLLGRYLRLFNYSHSAVPYLEQEVLARFMEEGLWDAHLRRMATIMHKRHDMLLDELEAQMGKKLVISGKQAGMHFYVHVKNDMTQDELIQTALEHDAAVYGTQRMWFSRHKPDQDLIIGFSSLALEDIPAGVAALAKAWF